MCHGGSCRPWAQHLLAEGSPELTSSSAVPPTYASVLLEGQAPTHTESCVPKALVDQTPVLILGVVAAGLVRGWVDSLGKGMRLTGLRTGVFWWEVAEN